MLTLLSILFILVCILLIFMVVITPSQGDGLASAFGGGGGDTFFGTKAGQHVNRFTVFLAASFLVLAIVINRVQPTEASSDKRSILTNPPPTAAPAPAPSVPGPAPTTGR